MFFFYFLFETREAETVFFFFFCSRNETSAVFRAETVRGKNKCESRLLLCINYNPHGVPAWMPMSEIKE